MNEDKVKQIDYRAIRILPIIIAIAVLVSGCVQPIKLIPMDTGSKSSFQEFTINNYKCSLRLIQIREDYNYLCSLKLVNKLDGMPVKNIEATMMVNKYPSRSLRYDRRYHGKWTVFRAIESVKDTLARDFDYNYKLPSKGKYELKINVKVIDGKELDKEISISFDHEVK